MKCKKGYEILPVKNDADQWYMGTVDRKGMPNCRLTDYAPSKEAAVRYPVYKQFCVAANEYCNGGSGCFE